MGDEQRVHVGSRDFWIGELDGRQVVLVLSRVGKVAAAATAAALASRFGTSAIVFTGVAGALSPQVAIGDVVVSAEFLQHDMDASPLFPRWEIPLTGIARFAADAALAEGLAGSARDVLMNPTSLVEDAVMHAFGLAAPRVHTGLIVSGDRFVSTAAESGVLRSALPDALAVEMEGAAVAQVCHEWGIPFAAVRIISDRADDAASIDFPRFIAEVESRYSVAIIRHWLNQVPGHPGSPLPDGSSHVSFEQDRKS
jgi:adenosylhomocysteine nucleosidase